MAPRLRQAISVCVPPRSCLRVLAVEVEDIDIGSSAHGDSHQRAGISPPQFAQTSLIALRLLEAMRRCRAFVSQTREAEPPFRAQRQCGTEGRPSVWSGHDRAPDGPGVCGAWTVRLLALGAAGASTGSVIGWTGLLHGLPRGRRGAAVSATALLAGAMIGVLVGKARQSSSSTIVRPPLFLVRSLPDAIEL